MATTMQPVKLRLSEADCLELHRLHPGYGEAQRVIRGLVGAYLEARKATAATPGREAEAVATAVLGRVR